jgi:hypothetical protein
MKAELSACSKMLSLCARIDPEPTVFYRADEMVPKGQLVSVGAVGA